jgi:hypothetical protein
MDPPSGLVLDQGFTRAIGGEWGAKGNRMIDHSPVDGAGARPRSAYVIPASWPVIAVVDAVGTIPIVAAGDAATLTFGAAGILMGNRFAGSTVSL